MDEHFLRQKAGEHLHKLCLDLPTRRVGSQGNREASAYFAESMRAFGFEIEMPSFDCIDWSQDGASLRAGGEEFEVQSSPYSLGGQVNAPLTAASTIESLEAAEVTGKVLLLYGEIAKEQVMPKNFSFYNPEHHQRIVRALEEKRPAAIIAATSRDPGLAGGVYPFPLIEDGDFDIPSVYMKDVEGDKLVSRVGEAVDLEIAARRIPATGVNVVARKGAQPDRRVVLFAHIDAKEGTPGAVDNATGVVTLLLLGELLVDYAGRLGVEIVAMNGEDYYSAPGEMLYMAENEGRFDEILLGINLDGAGYYRGKTAYSLYESPPEILETVRKVFSGHPGMVEGEPWYQSDHSLFLVHHRPALAITSDNFLELTTEITHTPKDRPEIVDLEKLVEIAEALRQLVLRLEQS